jgi:hypothetical protein
MIKAESGKKAKSRARVSLKRDKGKRIRDKSGNPLPVIRDAPAATYKISGILARWAGCDKKNLKD